MSKPLVDHDLLKEIAAAALAVAVGLALLAVRFVTAASSCFAFGIAVHTVVQRLVTG